MRDSTTGFLAVIGVFIAGVLWLAAYAAFLIGVLYAVCWIVKHFFFT